ncbi:MAG: hypothetical protein HW412_1279 [Bacteroidetes bacterium]|nr:hypothetical protein [Bacteroidota bacterium]
MNVFISNSTGIYAGGENYVLILAKHLRQRGHHVWVSANPDHLLLSKCAQAGIPTIPISYTGMSRVFSVASEVRAHLRQLSIDIIHSNANYDRTVAAIAAAWSGTRHVATVHSAHSIQHNITHWLRNRLGIDRFVAVADAVKNVLVNEDRISERKVAVVPIGVEEPARERHIEWRAKIRSQLGIPPEVCLVGNVARLVPFKGHRYLLEAVALVSARCKDVLFVVAGDGHLLATLQDQATSLKIGEFIRFLGFRDDLHEVYPAFDIYCQSSLELMAEAFPVAILDAMAAGLPIVSTRVGGIGMMVEEGISGHLVPPEDPPALAKALLHLIGDEQLRRSMGRASYDLFAKNFRAQTMAERIENVYLQVTRR